MTTTTTIPKPADVRPLDRIIRISEAIYDRELGLALRLLEDLELDLLDQSR